MNKVTLNLLVSFRCTVTDVEVVFVRENPGINLLQNGLCSPGLSFIRPCSAATTIYLKIPIISPGLTFVQTAYFRGSLFSERLVIGRNFAFQNCLGLTIKTAFFIKDYEKSPKQCVTLTVRWLIFGRAYNRKDICV